MVGSGHEIVGQKSTRVKDTSDTFDGQYSTTLSYTLDAEKKLVPNELATQSNIVQGSQTGTDTYYEKHSYELTNGGVAATYGGGYVLKSTTPITGSYGPIAHNKLWFGPQTFGKIGYQGELGEYTMASPPIIASLPAPHTTLDPTAGTEPSAFQDPGGTGAAGQDDVLPYYRPLGWKHRAILDGIMRSVEQKAALHDAWTRKLEAERAELEKSAEALWFAIQVAKIAEAAYVGNGMTDFLKSEGWDLVEGDRNRSTGFAYKLFKNPRTGDYVLAFAGTDDLQDWLNNFSQVFGNVAAQYEQSLDTAMRLKEKFRIPDNKFLLAGHSLGGGMASFVSIVLGVPAITFNASGVAQVTVAWYDKTLDAVERLILAIRVDGELLSTTQDAWFIPIPYFFWLPWVAPDSVGRRITVYGNSNNPLELHGMHQVLLGMRMLLENLRDQIGKMNDRLGDQ